MSKKGDLGLVVADVYLELVRRAKDYDGALVLALHGDLGAGKTTFVQDLIGRLGNMHDTVTSPTFVIMKSYELTLPHLDRVVHIDAYRIEDIDEMRPLHFSELLEDKRNLICIEWAEHIAELLPPQTGHLTITNGAQKDNPEYRHFVLKTTHV